jgi:hypothetical protein
MCNNALAMASCGAPLGRTVAAGQSPPGFAQLCYDAARIVTVETLTPIGKKLACLFQSTSPGGAARAQCVGGAPNPPAAASADPNASSTDECRTVIAPPPADGAHAVRGILTFVREVSDHPKAWCSKDGATPDDRRLYLRAFVHRIYDYRCQYRRALAAAGSANALAAPGPSGETSRAELAADDAEIGEAAAGIFRACDAEVPVFASDAWMTRCNGAIPKAIP